MRQVGLRSDSVVLWACLVALATVLASPAPAQVWPVRLDEARSPGTGPALDVSADLAPYTLTVETVGGLESATIPIEEISTRCGDRDGCTVRLVGYAGRRQPAKSILVGPFTTSEDGIQWRIFRLLALRNQGTLTLEPDEIIIEAGRGEEDTCRFEEVSLPPEPAGYQLTAVDPFGTFYCLLRIDD